MLKSPLLFGCALFGAYTIITNIGGWSWLGSYWQKYQKAAPKDAQEIQQIAKPVIQNIQQIQGGQPNAQPSPTTPKPESKNYGVRLELRTPIGSINTGTQLTPAEQDQLTRKDLGE